MITELSPELKSHIEEYIEEIEQNRINESIIKCPLNILDDYVHVLKQIDMEPRKELKTYIDIATYLSSKIDGYAHCCNIEVHGLDDVTYEFEVNPQPLIDWETIERDLIRLCPYHYVQCAMSHEFFGLPRRSIKVNVLSVGKFRF